MRTSATNLLMKTLGQLLHRESSGASAKELRVKLRPVLSMGKGMTIANDGCQRNASKLSLR